jgi:hypothetical protein
MLGLHEATFDQVQTQKIQDCLANYRAYIEYRNTTDTQGNRINNEEYQGNVINYNVELIKTLTNPQNQDLINKYQSNVQNINQINQFVNQSSQILNNITLLIDPLNKSINSINVNVLSTTPVPNIVYATTVAALQANIDLSSQKLTTLTTENNAISGEFKKQGINQDISSLLTKVNECQTQIDLAKNKLKEIEEKNGKYFSLVEERIVFAKCYQIFLDNQVTDVNSAFAMLGQQKDTWNQEQNELVQDILLDINIYGAQSFNLELFYDGLLNCLNRGKFRETSNQSSLEKLKKTFNIHNIDNFFTL